ncbi:MAG: hypothetical protein WAM39_12055 [Bryobacteraceae bacterium]
MSESVWVTGSGIAAHACARLLRRANVRVCLKREQGWQSPVVLLSSVTQRLLHDVFEDPQLFTGVHPIRKRVVRWGGTEAHTLAIPHMGVAVAESELLSRIGPTVADRQPEKEDEPTWTIACSRTFPERSRRHFGERTACAFPVVLSRECDAESCYVESVSNGWLFLLPFSRTEASLLCVGAQAGVELLERSQLVARQISTCGSKTSSFRAHPSILDGLASLGRIACGAAAVSFDPLCGEGMGNAIREAILASAVVRASLSGGRVDDLILHYKSCLLGGFLRHLETCEAFYSSGPQDDWWQTEQLRIRDGIDWVRQRLPDQPFRFRLSGFDLEEMDLERPTAGAFA